MKTYTGKCAINRGNGDLICKGINTLNILDTVLVSMMAPQLLEWNQLMYLRCMMTVGAQVSHPHHSDLLPLSVYEAVAFPAFSCQRRVDWLESRCDALTADNRWMDFDPFILMMHCSSSCCLLAPGLHLYRGRLFVTAVTAVFIWSRSRVIQTGCPVPPHWKFWRQLELVLSFRTA